MKVPLHRAIQKYGPRRFTIATLRECSNQVEANASEVEFINLHQSRDKDRGYNVMPGGIFMVHTEPVRAKARAALKGRVISESWRRNLSLAHSKRTSYHRWTESERAQISARMKGNKHGQGAVFTKERRAKIAAATGLRVKGKKQSPETIAKRSESVRLSYEKNPKLREMRAAVCALRVGRLNPNFGKRRA